MSAPDSEDLLIEPTALSPLVTSPTSTCSSISPTCQKEKNESNHARQKWTVHAIYVSNLLQMVTYSSITPSVLLYLNSRAFTTSSDVTAFVVTTVLESAGPMIMHVAIARIAASRSHSFATTLFASAAAAGLSLIVLKPSSLFLFYAGYFTYASSDALRTVRLSLITTVVPPERRTAAISVNVFMMSVGALVGPLVWIAVQGLRMTYTLSFLGLTVYISPFSLNFLISTLAFIVIAFLAYVFFHVDSQYKVENDDSEVELFPSANEWHPVTVEIDGQSRTLNLRTYRAKVFGSFCVALIAISFSTGVYFLSLQPILVNIFGRDETAMGRAFELIGVLSIVPPVLVSFLSRYVRDRTIMAIGLCVKLTGMGCFLGTAVPEWRVVVGYLLLVKASLFFIPTAISLCSKLLGPLLSPTHIGVLQSLCTVGAAAAQLTAGRWVMAQFNTPAFALYTLPTVGLMLVASNPRVWAAANDDDAITQALLAKASEQKEHYKRRAGD